MLNFSLIYCVWGNALRCCYHLCPISEPPSAHVIPHWAQGYHLGQGKAFREFETVWGKKKFGTEQFAFVWQSSHVLQRDGCWVNCVFTTETALIIFCIKKLSVEFINGWEGVSFKIISIWFWNWKWISRTSFQSEVEKDLTVVYTRCKLGFSVCSSVAKKSRNCYWMTCDPRSGGVNLKLLRKVFQTSTPPGKLSRGVIALLGKQILLLLHRQILSLSSFTDYWTAGVGGWKLVISCHRFSFHSCTLRSWSSKVWS